MNPRRAAAPLLLLAAAIVASGCATARLERKLDPDSRVFLSKVRYLITPDERRAFLNVPASERPAFMAEFWRTRDPDPDTEENELKTQYFQRIEEANRLFSGGGSPGWLQDRGRIYILLGPPSDRETYPRGVSFYGVPAEIWHYGFFPIVFLDEAWTGDYKLDPGSPYQLAEIMQTQMAVKPRPETDPAGLAFDLTVAAKGPNELALRLEVPYTRIWMNPEGNTLKTVLTVTVALEDEAGGRILEESSEHPLALTDAELEKLAGRSLAVERTVGLKPGARLLMVTLANSADKSKVSKRRPLGR